MASYFDPFPCERSGRLHRILGTRRLRPFVAGGLFWQRLGLAKARRWNRATVPQYIAHSKLLEVAHTASFLFLLLVIAILIVKDDWLGVLVFTVVNILANAYPVLVTRFNRHRIERRMARSPRS